LIVTVLLGTFIAGEYPGLQWHYEPLPEEQHSTIHHPAAMRAFRKGFAPAPAEPPGK
jgi:hypothetical protein